MAHTKIHALDYAMANFLSKTIPSIAPLYGFDNFDDWKYSAEMRLYGEDISPIADQCKETSATNQIYFPEIINHLLQHFGFNMYLMSRNNDYSDFITILLSMKNSKYIFDILTSDSVKKDDLTFDLQTAIYEKFHNSQFADIKDLNFWESLHSALIGTDFNRKWIQNCTIPTGFSKDNIDYIDRTKKLSKSREDKYYKMLLMLCKENIALSKQAEIDTRIEKYTIMAGTKPIFSSDLVAHNPFPVYFNGPIINIKLRHIETAKARFEADTESLNQTKEYEDRIRKNIMHRKSAHAGRRPQDCLLDLAIKSKIKGK